MGIVVAVALLVALFMMSFESACRNSKYRVCTILGVTFVTLTGAWNTCWYGVQNIPSFWGTAALLSGVFMLFTAQFIYLEVKKSPWVQHALYFDLKLITTISLGLYLLLYVVTLIQINLEMPILS